MLQRHRRLTPRQPDQHGVARVCARLSRMPERTLIFTSLLAWQDVVKLMFVIEVSSEHNTDCNAMWKLHGADSSTTRQQLAVEVYYTIITHLVVAVVLKVGLLITTLMLQYGLLRAKPLYIRLYLYFNLPVWAFCGFSAAVMVFYNSTADRFLAALLLLLIGYQLLAARSAYRMLTGKSKLFHESNTSSIGYSNPLTFAITPNTPLDYNTSSCDTGNRLSIVMNTNNTTRANTPRTENVTETNESEIETTSSGNDEGNVIKEINLKDEALVFDPNQLIRRHPLLVSRGDLSQNNLMIEETVQTESILVNRAIRPNTLVFGANGPYSSKNDCEKIDLGDVAIIFDEQQLNIGGSPIFENSV